ncbi:MAG: ABC transporter ATP-binding protein [Desulfobacterales bacterium]|jgi:cobalt/nickel transport system ATP-binding protein|nr:ABC transporter ATP-binding protein [Desulfobacterales bacterium]MDD3080832.1 ABC transporter ATP-binding protein [Desulfobacterales bacterium]MDD3950084.1 ABC transporter ATP-binding protein [Desulfobacterales bacterium]MDY0376829.1 ABC transporter ATP-binding protein [Desulfobacterales bacterium]
MSHHIVEVRDLAYQYPDGTSALRGISFRITHGESVAVVGSNGAGKSTLLLHLTGALKSASGEIRIGDFPVTAKTLPMIRRTVGMVFQDPDDQLFMPTVTDDVAFGPLNLGLPAEEVRNRVREALAIVGAGHLGDRPPYRLSQGEKRAVSIATVLAMSPDILVMDEPTANMDPTARRQVIELLKTFEHTKIIATHDLDLAMDLCRRTLIIHEGRMVADGATLEIMQDEALLKQNRLEKPLRMQGCPVCGFGRPDCR